jgi:hypothetical protein
MRAEGHRDSQIEAHSRTHFLMNLRSERKVAALSAGSSRPREAQAGAGSHSGGVPVAEVLRRRSSLHQRLEDDEEVESEV